ncbi:MAG: efflux RND transporter permease subunit, partial [Candidatus Cloacimonadales bacterium]
MKLQKFTGTFYKSLLFIITLQLMACAGVNKQLANQQPEKEVDPKIANTASAYYFMMAETALTQGDLEMALQLYLRADKAAPRNIFIKETILEILEMGLQHEAEAADKIVALGEDYLKRDLISEKILNVLAVAYRSKQQDKKLEEILQLQIDNYPSMRGYLLHYYFTREKYQREDKELLQLALQQEWKDINEVLSVAFELNDAQQIAEIIEKSYAKWTSQELEKAEILTLLENRKADQVFTDLIEAALYSGEKFIEEIARYYLSTLSRNQEYERILAAAPYMRGGNSSVINELVFSAAVEKQEWSLVAALGESLLSSTQLYAPQYTLLNTAMARAKMSEYEAALRLISSVEDYRELSFILSYIYPEIPEAGQKKSYQLVEHGLNTVNLVVSPADGVNALRLASKVKEEVIRIKQQLPPGYTMILAYDATEFIRDELQKIGLRTLFSMLILLFFVFIVSRKWRYLFLILVSIVCNLLLAVIFYYLFKIEMHLYSLAGITVSFGMLI